jgi:hypothetical protein
VGDTKIVLTGLEVELLVDILDLWQEGGTQAVSEADSDEEHSFFESAATHLDVVLSLRTKIEEARTHRGWFRRGVFARIRGKDPFTI